MLRHMLCMPLLYLQMCHGEPGSVSLARQAYAASNECILRVHMGL